MNKNLLISGALVLNLGALVLVAAGCNASDAQSPRLVAGAASRDLSGRPMNTAVRNFPRGDISFNGGDNLLLMWKKDNTPDDVATVLNNTTYYESAEEQIYLLSERRVALKASFDSIHVDIIDYSSKISDELPSKRATLASAQKLLVDQQKLLTDRQADLSAHLTQLATAQAQLDALKAQPASDEVTQQIAAVTAQIAELNAQVTQLKSDVAASTKQVASTTKQVKRIGAQVADLEQETQQTQSAIAIAHLEASVADWNDVESNLTKQRAEAAAYLAPINQSVWVFNSDPAPKFSFRFDAGGNLQVLIRNWNLAKIDDPEVAEADVPTEFSTETTATAGATVAKPTFDELGGVFTFEVRSPRAVYWFKIARTNYDALDRRIHYKGDIVRCSVDGGTGTPVIVHVRDHVECRVTGSGAPSLRRGAANLVDLDVNS